MTHMKVWKCIHPTVEYQAAKVIAKIFSELQSQETKKIPPDHGYDYYQSGLPAKPVVLTLVRGNFRTFRQFLSDFSNTNLIWREQAK